MSNIPEPKVVIICGAPHIGKLDLLKEISKITGKEIVSYEDEKCIKSLEVTINNNRVNFITAINADFYMQKISNHIFAKTDMVVYIFPKEIKYVEMQETNEIYFEIYQRIAKKLNKAPEFIPWLIVMKRFYNPLIKEQLLPFIIPLQNNMGIEFIDYKENVAYENLSVTFNFTVEFEGTTFLLGRILDKLFNQ